MTYLFCAGCNVPTGHNLPNRKYCSLKCTIINNTCKDPETGCWNWTGQISRYGYAYISDGAGRALTASRVSYEEFNGPLGVGMLACHKCDNRRCVNPDHLFAGTQQDNVLDMYAKGRRREKWLQGSKHQNSKLKEKDVLYIRKQAKGRKEIIAMAEKFSVTPGTIYQIVQRKTWTHI